MGSKLKVRFFFAIILSLLTFMWSLSFLSSITKFYTQGFSEKQGRDVLSVGMPSPDNTTLMVDDTGARSLSQKVRIFCWITSQEKELKKKLAAVNETWAKRCDNKMYVMSTKLKIDGVVDLNVTDGRSHLAEKTIAAMKHIYNNHLLNYDWFLKADDDTYIVMENLKYLLSHYNPKEPVYLGHLFKKYSKWGYMSGGAGYVLSKEAVRILVEKGYKAEGKCKKSAPDEDVEIGHCLHAVGITVHDTRDRFGRQSFQPFGVFDHIAGPIPAGLPNWERFVPVKGNGCCSELLISFHYNSPQMIRTIEHFLYRTTVYGRQRDMEKFKHFFKIGTVPPPEEVVHKPPGKPKPSVTPKPVVTPQSSVRSKQQPSGRPKPSSVMPKAHWNTPQITHV